MHEKDVCFTYNRNRFVGGPGHDSTNCDQIGQYCQMIASEEEDKYFCQGQNQNVWHRFLSFNLVDTIANLINHSWYTRVDGKPKKDIDNYYDY